MSNIFDPRPHNVRNLIDKVALGEVFIRVLLVSNAFVISPMLSTHLHPQVAPTRRTNGRNLGTIQTAMLFRKLESIREKILFFT
jgi:hypothetical protein